MAGVSGRSCWDREDLLSAYLDGELGYGELDEVVAHLESCAECLGSFHAVKEARAALRLLPPVEPPRSMFTPYHLSDRLSAYLDGELDTAEVDVVTHHLGQCRDCRMELQGLDGARTAIRALPRLELPQEVGAEVVEPRRRPMRRTAALVVAAVATAAVGLTMLRTEPVTPLDLDQLATRHNARLSVEAGFSVIPASVSTGATTP